MDLNDMVIDVISLFCREINPFEVEGCDGLQGNVRPREEPVDDRRGDKSREVSAADSKCAAGRRHRKHEMEVLADGLLEERPLVVRVVRDSFLQSKRPTQIR